jgi:cell division protease FtsH
VDLPDVKGRLAIIKVHVRGKPISNQVDLSIIAKRTTGFSGASLANLMNEAAIVAARKSKTEIEYEDIDYAIDRQQVGMQKNTGMKFPNRQKLVAYHEAGHAVAGLMLPEYDMVTKVTIVPRTNGAGGFTLFTPSEERMETGMYTKKYLKNQLVVALGGRMAEELVYGEKEVTTGASNDLQQVRSIARRMVAQWGFANAEMGNAPVAWELEQGNGINAGMVVASPTTEKEIDKQVEKLVKEAYDRRYALLTKHRGLMDEMTERLIAEETIDYTDLEKMRDQHLKTLEAVSASSAAA